MKNVLFGSTGPVGHDSVDVPSCKLGLGINSFSCVELFIWWRHLKKILCSGILDEREDLEDDEEEEGSPFDFTG